MISKKTTIKAKSINKKAVNSEKKAFPESVMTVLKNRADIPPKLLEKKRL
jgi:hypothetical protein